MQNQNLLFHDFTENIDLYFSKLKDLMFSRKSEHFYNRDKIYLNLCLSHYKSVDFHLLKFNYYKIVNDHENSFIFFDLKLDSNGNLGNDIEKYLFIIYRLFTTKYSLKNNPLTNLIEK